METKPEICLTVPGDRSYAVVIRTALGGIALLKDLSVDALDDLRMDADEACDCLLHQNRPAHELKLEAWSDDRGLTVRLSADLGECDGTDCEDRVAISRTILETLIPEPRFHTQPCGCIDGITMTLPRAAM